MSRIIDTNAVGKQRTQLQKAIVIAIRELMQQSKPSAITKDLAAFIAIALLQISEGVEITVKPWEKRNYWVKADAFRRDWAWADSFGKQMKTATFEENWFEIAQLAAKVGSKLNKIEVSPRHRMGRPWEGAWEILKNQ